MENFENQNPYTALKPAPKHQPDDDRIGRSSECLWMGIISAVGFIVAYFLFYLPDSFSMEASALASIFAMLLCGIAGIAGIAGLFFGGIEAIAHLSSKSFFGQKETVFAGIALCLTGPALWIISFCSSY